MIDLPYLLVMEATNAPTFFGFCSPDFAGFSGTGHSIEDCLYHAKRGMKEHVMLLETEQLSFPSLNPQPTC
jgi:predicted RNase H-like HicB family nuclease